MFSFNDKLSIRQLQILIILNSFGIGIINLPRIAAENAGPDGWISVIISVLIALLGIYIMTSLTKRFPDKSFYEYTTVILGRPLAMILSVLFIIKIILLISYELYYFVDIISLIMLKTTPKWIITISLLLVSGFAAMKGYETRGRIAELLIFLTLIPLIIVFSIASLDIDFTNIMPVLKTPSTDILRGGIKCFSGFMGMEAILLIYPYFNNKKRIRRASLIAVLITGIIFAVITFITISRFGPDTIKAQPWPVLEMMDTIDLPGSFIERQEAIIMSFWIVAMFAIVNAGLFFSSLISKSIVKKGKHSYFVFLYIVIIAVVTQIMGKAIKANEMIDNIYAISSWAFIFIIPSILMIVAKVRGLINEKA